MAKKATKPKPAARGRKKEKVVVSVRLDKEVMEMAYEHIKKTGTRINEFLEYGVFEAIRGERNLDMPSLKAKFLVQNANYEQKRVVMQVLGMLTFPAREFNETDRLMKDAFLSWLNMLEQRAGYSRAMKAYGALPPALEENAAEA